MRPTIAWNRSKVRYLLSVPVFVIVLLNIELISQIKDFNSSGKNSELVNPNWSQIIQNDNLTKIQHSSNSSQIIQILRLKIKDQNSQLPIRNRNFIESILQNEIKVQNILNKTTNRRPKTSPVYKMPKFIVILIQVHSRLNYLKELINSLKETKYIEQALVVFSHDIYDEEMNTLIKSIDFCATLQIFYPYSLQLYPDTFPGKDSNDCPRSLNKAKALEIGCNNAAYPDTYGNYRESQVVQIKHHWFWKLAFIFDRLNETKLLDNLHILMLEEDHYLLPDSIHVLHKLSEKILSDIDVVSLAIFDRSKQNLEMNNLKKYAKGYWHSSKHNTGLMLSRTQWKMIKDCSNAFCTYDDYNWDWTLQYISQSCFKLPLVAIYPVSSRVIHMGECGTHHKGSNCDPKAKIENLKQTMERKKNDLFSDKFDLNAVNTGILTIKKSNGGWGDPRDHNLCKSFIDPDLNSNSTILIEM
ncbi:alpha-1-6-mannosyl-glyco 2-beta-N-acetylglucosaminyltransferase [Brachionus plicatilis]|uniref:Alpha-1,6-mannosyl-glycoprotein 2-beta-N-acetylglucosaminyltransferase n=1 Tax=Brachionus plicatilis TaxID=10195 RepID=A0A3M7PF88_BRAPC|nr:alpha-1-6-mannosyl-glyco 2-beta-N-acetylglucosaminyltransferase [Brachionus plicatilis]